MWPLAHGYDRASDECFEAISNTTVSISNQAIMAQNVY